MGAAVGFGTLVGGWRRWAPSAPDEVRRAAGLFVYLFLIIASYIALKAVRDALFIDAFGAMRLPYVMIGIAGVVALFSDLYIRLARRTSTPNMAVGTLLVLALSLVIFWQLAKLEWRGLYPLLYVWVGAFGVIAPVQGWSLAAEILCTREARRLLGFIGTGGILGGVVGGATVGALARRVGSVAMLLVVAATLIVCAGLVIIISWRRSPPAEVANLLRPVNLPESVRRILGSMHLRLVAGIVFISAFTTTVVDWEFKAAAGAAGMSRDQLASFFGAAYGAMSLISLAVQVLAVRWLMRKWGLGVAVLVLPLSLIFGSALFAPLGVLWAAVLLKAGDGAFKHSVDRSSKELSYLPVPSSVKVQAKTAIDMVADRLGDGLGGLLLLALATWLGLRASQLAWGNLGLAAVWIFLALRMRRSYLDELGRSIGAEQGRLEGAAEFGVDADARRVLRLQLATAKGEQLLAALDLAALAPGPDMARELGALAESSEPGVRARALRALLQPGAPGLPQNVTRELRSDDEALLVLALDMVLAQTEEEVQQRAELLLAGGSPDERGALLALLIHRLGSDFDPVSDRILDSLTRPGAPASTRTAAAHAIGLLAPAGGRIALLERLMRDDDPGVRGAASESAGRLRRLEFIEPLLGLLAVRGTRARAFRALTAFGAGAVPALARALGDERTPARIRRQIPRLLGQIGGAEAVSVLVRCIDGPDAGASDSCLAALLWHKRRGAGAAIVPEAILLERVHAEIEDCERLLGARAPLREAGADPAIQVATRAVQERLERERRRMLRLLELLLPADQVEAARRGLEAGDRAKRENALELLEGLLRRDLKAKIIPILEQIGDERGAGPPAIRWTLDQALRRLAAGPDRWLAACAAHAAARLGRTLDGAPAGRSGGERETIEVVTLMEKVVALKAVESLRTMPTVDLAHLARLARDAACADGQTLGEALTTAEPLFVIVRGRVQLPSGDELESPKVGAEGAEGWFALSPGAEAFGAVARGPVQVMVVDREDFFELLAEHGELARHLVDELLRRLSPGDKTYLDEPGETLPGAPS